MGSCLSDNKSISRAKKIHTPTQGDPFNPIIKVVKNWDLQMKRKKWQDNESQILTSKLQSTNKPITYSQFNYLFPGLKPFSQTTVSNLYSVFNFQRQKELSRIDFLIAYGIIVKNDNHQLLSDIFFFVYSNHPQKKYIDSDDFILFQRQFKQYELDLKHTKKKVKRDQNGQQYISNEDFREIFLQYDIKSIKQIFSFSLDQEEKKFAKKLKVNGVDKLNNQDVFLIEFRWFIKWKSYMEMKYAFQVQMKENGKALDIEKIDTITHFLKRRNSLTTASKILAADNKRIERLDNNPIKSEQPNELKQNLIQFQNYTCVPQWIWKYYRVIYGGGPPIRKVYPNVYNKKITLVLLQQKKPKFYKNYIKTLEDYNESTKFERVFDKYYKLFGQWNSPKQYSVFYKYPGKLQWSQIPITTQIQNCPLHFRSFIVFVHKKVRSAFIENYNIIESNGVRKIKCRVQNYASILNFEHNGILKQGYVKEILKNHTIVLNHKNQKGTYLRVQERTEKLQKQNPSEIRDEIKQGLAGLQNIGNTCYMNAVIQSLIRTPFFTEYLSTFQYGRNKDEYMTFQLHNIAEKSRTSRDCIDMSKFKNKFDEYFEFFQGSAQHDAQEFLILLLDKISEQKQSQSKVLIKPGKQIQVNQTIMKFFSGQTQATTTCLQCKNKGHSKQPFFTYSLSLPHIQQRIFQFFFIDQKYKVSRYCMFIPNNMQIGALLSKIADVLKIKRQMLWKQASFQGQWSSNLDNQPYQKQVQSLSTFDMNIVCYKVLSNQEPQYVDFRYSKKNTTVKLQLRNRFYNSRRKQYTSFFFPFYVEIDENTNGKMLIDAIQERMEKFIDRQQFKKWKQQFEENILKDKENQNEKKPITDKGSLIQPLTSQFTPTPGQQILPYQIRFVRNSKFSSSICWFCRRQIHDYKYQNDPDQYCNGCQFDKESKLFQNSDFSHNWDRMVGVIDWRNQTIIKNFNIENTSTCKQVEQKENQKQPHIQKLLKQTYNQEEILQLKCQNASCRNNQVTRSQKIIKSPNILILHLKRFQFIDGALQKMRNKVIIPQNLVLPGTNDKYQLYSNIVHHGSGRGGHYVNYVNVEDRWFKCDDEKVFQQKTGNHLNDQAYLLFYKKKQIQKNLKGFML